MSSIDWQRVRPLLARLLELPASEHSGFLEQACAGDEELLRTVRRLHADHRADSDFLKPVVGAGSREASASHLEPGRFIGPWRLDRLVDAGGMGEVWLAERPDLHQRAALKFVRAGLDSPENVARFHRERVVLAGLEHTNVARLLDGGTLDDGRPWLAMEFVDGMAIDAYCDSERLDVEGRIRLVLPILDAVEAAHRALIVHRDLKPSNILVQQDGEPKLLDFGIAKNLAQNTAVDVTSTGPGPMTARYASPEQIEGRPVTTASDVYSLGVLLFELLTGTSPYGPKTASVQILSAVCEAVPEAPSVVAAGRDAEEVTSFGRDGRPSRLARKLSGELDWIVGTALRKEPGRRYASVWHLAEDLRRYLDRQPVEAGPDSLAYRASRFVARHRSLVAAALLATTALIAGGISNARATRRARLAAEQEGAALDAAADTIAFLSELVSSPTPDHGRGKQALVVDALRDVGEQIDGIASPYARWAAHDWVGTALCELGETENGIHHLRAAITIADDLGESGIALARTHGQLGVALERTGRDDEAVPVLQRALALLDGPPSTRLDRIVRYPSPAAIRLSASNVLANALRGLHREVEALEAYRSLLQGLEGLEDADSEHVLLSFNAASVLLSLGELEEARQGIEAAFAALQRLEGVDTEFAVGVTAGYGHVTSLFGQSAEIVDLMRRNVARAKSVFLADHPVLWDAELGLARALVDVGKYEECSQVAESLHARPGADGAAQELELASIRARCWVRLGRADEALALLEGMLSRAEEVYPDEPGPHGFLQWAAAECYAVLGRPESETARARAEELLTAFAGPGNPFLERLRREFADAPPQ